MIVLDRLIIQNMYVSFKIILLQTFFPTSYLELKFFYRKKNKRERDKYREKKNQKSTKFLTTLTRYKN